MTRVLEGTSVLRALISLIDVVVADNCVVIREDDHDGDRERDVCDGDQNGDGYDNAYDNVVDLARQRRSERRPTATGVAAHSGCNGHAWRPRSARTVSMSAAWHAHA
jgi:hypothetical protein